MNHSVNRRVRDFVTFPLRALTLFNKDKWGLSSLRSERFEYVAKEVLGYCLDVGCGRNNLFVSRYLNGNGVGIDVFRYEGLTSENILEDITRFPFKDNTFDSVTFIATINHIPKSKRDLELAEAYRCLKPSGNVIVTMGNASAEILVHNVVHLYDILLGTQEDVDSERGIGDEEAYYLTDREIIDRLSRAGFANIRKKHLPTQWALNHLFIAWKI